MKLVCIHCYACARALSDCAAEGSSGGCHSGPECIEDESTDLSDFIVGDDEPVERFPSSSISSSSACRHIPRKRRLAQRSSAQVKRRPRKRPCVPPSSSDEGHFAEQATLGLSLDTDVNGFTDGSVLSRATDAPAVLAHLLLCVDNIQRDLNSVRASLASLCGAASRRSSGMQ